MKRLINWFQSRRVGQAIGVFLVAIATFAIAAFYSGCEISALAESLPPDAQYYQLRRTAANEKAFTNQTPSDNYLENAQHSYQNTAEKIREGHFDKLLPNAKNYVHLDETHSKNTPEVVNGMPPSDDKVDKALEK